MDYEIGYKKPPRSWCFKKGASGNRAGRPKNVVDPRESAAQRAWNETLQIDIGGRTRTITMREFRVRSLVPGCLAGDLDAMEALYRLSENDPAPAMTVKTVSIKHVR
jgi:hypothetical protein